MSVEQPRYQPRSYLDATSCVILDYSVGKAFSEIVVPQHARTNLLDGDGLPRRSAEREGGRLRQGRRSSTFRAES